MRFWGGIAATRLPSISRFARKFSMRAQCLGAVLSISVDLPSGPPAGSSLADRLVHLFTAATLPATWFAGDPGNAGILSHALAADVGHEVGLRVQSEGVRPLRAGGTLKRELQQGRSRLIAGILEHLARAKYGHFCLHAGDCGCGRSAGGIAGQTRHLGRLRRRERSQNGRSDGTGPLPLRYGLWQLSADFRLTGGGRFAEWRMAMRIRRAIDQCMRNQVPLHLSIDAAEIGANSSIERLGGVPAILRHVDRCRAEGPLEVCTIAGLVARLAAPTAMRSAGSILRGVNPPGEYERRKHLHGRSAARSVLCRLSSSSSRECRRTGSPRHPLRC